MKIVWPAQIVACMLVALCSQSANTTKAPASTKETASRSTTPAPARQGLTVDDVLTMVQAGLSEDVIIARLRREERAFDLGPDDLIRLKQANTSDSVLKVMMDPKSEVKTTPVVSAAAARAPSPAVVPGSVPTISTVQNNSFPTAVGVFFIKDDKYEQLAPEMGRGRLNAKRLLAGPIVKQKNENKVSGGSSANKTSDALPRLLLHMPNRDPSKLNLLSVMERRDDERVLFVVEGRVSGSIKQNIVPVLLNESAPGYYEMRPRQPLSPGEYALVDYGAIGEPLTAWTFSVIR